MRGKGIFAQVGLVASTAAKVERDPEAYHVWHGVPIPQPTVNRLRAEFVDEVGWPQITHDDSAVLRQGQAGAKRTPAEGHASIRPIFSRWRLASSCVRTSLHD
jgi:hypothetical protein